MDLVDREFTATRPNQLWVSDFTYVATWRGFDDMEFAALEWVWWYIHQRLFGPLGHVPAAEFESQYYDSLRRYEYDASGRITRVDTMELTRFSRHLV